MLAVLFMSVGLMFLVYSRSGTDTSNQQIAERLVMSKWIGGSLITLANFKL